MAEDVQVALHADLQPLQSTFPAPELSPSARRVLKTCLEHQLQENVKLAQRRGLLPSDEELSKLPIFEQARHDDSHHIQRAEEEAAAREEARRRALEEAKRAEAERQRRAAEEAAEEAQRKKEAKEARRQARLQEKIEKLKRTRAEERRRYDELRSRWLTNVEERKIKLDEVKHAIATATEKKTAVQTRLSELSENKSKLLKQLRDLAAKGAAGDETGTTAGAGVNNKHVDEAEAPRSHLKRPREHQSTYYNPHHHRHSDDAAPHPAAAGLGGGYGSPRAKFSREGSYEHRAMDRDIREREYLGPSGHSSPGGGGAGLAGAGPGHYSKYSSYNDRPGREYGGIDRDRDRDRDRERGVGAGGGSGYIRGEVSLHGGPHHRQSGGGVERGRPSREEIEARERSGGGGYHRPQHEELRRDRDGPGDGGQHRSSWQERR